MVTIEQAEKLILKNAPDIRTEYCALPQTLGRTLAEDIIAREPSPLFTNSAMDGFAVRWTDIATAFQRIPIELPVAGESQAGIPYGGEVQAGQAIRISTGAMMPAGCDTVVPIEEIEFVNDHIKILNIRKKFQHVRHAGEEYKTGGLLLKKDKIIKPADIALLAMQGIAEVPVYARPCVALVSTGSELKPFDSGQLAPGEIRNSNSPMLQAAVEEAGGRITAVLHVNDERRATAEAIDKAVGLADIIISSGGVSVGPHDHVKEIAEEAGFEEVFWKVRQKPGKPMYVAKKGGALLIGLPGNPVSAFMCFTHYLKPLIEKTAGQAIKRKTLSATSGDDIKNEMDRTHLMRVRLKSDNGKTIFSALHLQGSHMPTSVAHADGYVVIMPHQLIRRDETTEVFLF